jgi:hypothetical protein
VAAGGRACSLTTVQCGATPDDQGAFKAALNAFQAEEPGLDDPEDLTRQTTAQMGATLMHLR